MDNRLHRLMGFQLYYVLGCSSALSSGGPTVYGTGVVQRHVVMMDRVMAPPTFCQLMTKTTP